MEEGRGGAEGTDRRRCMHFDSAPERVAGSGISGRIRVYLEYAAAPREREQERKSGEISTFGSMWQVRELKCGDATCNEDENDLWCSCSCSLSHSLLTRRRRGGSRGSWPVGWQRERGGASI